MSSGWHKQRALERRLFGPGPKSSRAKKKPVVFQKETAELMASIKPGNCRFCRNTCSLGDARSEWRCPDCGRVYFTLDAAPDGSLVTLFRDP